MFVFYVCSKYSPPNEVCDDLQDQSKKLKSKLLADMPGGDNQPGSRNDLLDSTAVWTVAPMIIHVKRVTMHSYPG